MSRKFHVNNNGPMLAKAPSKLYYGGFQVSDDATELRYLISVVACE